jgi:uncharacterized membrane protein
VAIDFGQRTDRHNAGFAGGVCWALQEPIVTLLERIVAFITGAMMGATTALLVVGLTLGGPLLGSVWVNALGSVGIGSALLWWWIRTRGRASP